MVTGKYIICRPLSVGTFVGEGWVSEVWLAEDRLTGLKVAIKVYAPGTGLDSDGMSVFSKELSLVYNLHHTNLLKPQHFDQCNNRPYLVLPYCEQGSALKLVGQMPEEEAWRFCGMWLPGWNICMPWSRQ